MCGRFVLKKMRSGGQIVDAFWRDLHALMSGYNISPSQGVLVYVPSASASMLPAKATWGFTSAYRPGLTINARAETIADKPMFNQAFLKRRCLVPAHGWYEWQALTSGKLPHFIHRADDQPMAFAGILQPGPAGKPPNLAIITTAASPALAHIHDRMPAIIPQDRWPVWLSPSTPPADLQAMLTPCQDPALVAHPVSNKVGSTRANDESLIQPIKPKEPDRGLFE
jgi:putative SOS response-associated peptidase YedK